MAKKKPNSGRSQAGLSSVKESEIQSGVKNFGFSG